MSLINEITNAGYNIKNLILDGRPHRFSTDAKPRKKNGWYIGNKVSLSTNKAIEVVTIGDWSTGDKKTFRSGKELKEAEAKIYKSERRKQIKAIEDEKNKAWNAASKFATTIYNTECGPIDLTNPYLVKKGINSVLTDVIKSNENGLVIPVMNISGEIRSLQTISKEGAKKFLKDGEISGNFCLLPEVGGSNSNIYLVCEGAATGLTLSNALSGKVNVVISFSACNMVKVTKKLLSSGVNSEQIIIACDNDRFSEKNAGLDAAEECTKYGVDVVFPKFKDEDLDSKPTDFNDMAVLYGIDSVTPLFLSQEAIGRIFSVLIADPPCSILGEASSISAPDIMPIMPITPVADVIDLSEYRVHLENGFYTSEVLPNGSVRKRPEFGAMISYFRDVLRFRAEPSGYYIYEEGCYRHIETNKVESEIIRLTKDNFDHSKNDLRHFMTLIIASCHEDQLPTLLSTEGLINCQNGILNIMTRELLPHSHKYGFKNILDYPYDPLAKCPRWDSFLDEVLPGEHSGLKPILAQFFGFTIGGPMFSGVHKALILYGDGRNGKSIVSEVMRNMCGIENCSDVSISLFENEFYRSMLADKMVNITDDLTQRDADSGIFKKIVGGGMIMASRKYEKQFSFVSRAKQLITTNHFPRFKDSTTGLTERLIIMEFPVTFTDEQQDPHLLQRLRAEGSGVLNWSLWGLSLLIQNKNKFYDHKLLREIKEEYKDESCSVSYFYSTGCVALKEGEFINKPILMREFFDEYLLFCLNNNIRHTNAYLSFSHKFRQILKKNIGKNSIKRSGDKANLSAVMGIVPVSFAGKIIRPNGSFPSSETSGGLQKMDDNVINYVRKISREEH